MATFPLINEKELLAQIANKDEHAFKLIYENYYQDIFKFAFRLLQSEQSAEEVIQETMLNIWLQGEKLTKINNLQAYIKTIAKRRAIDLLRLREEALQVEDYLLKNTDSLEPGNEEAQILEAARNTLAEGVLKLPEQQRMVYTLCYQKGLSYQEAAEIMNVSHGTVQTHMKLALKSLRAYVLKHGYFSVLLLILHLL